MNIEQARFNMIEQQIRPWNVLDLNVLDLLSRVKRELFVPEQYARLAFSDTEVPLPCGQSMFAPKIEARFMQALNVQPTDRILEVGTGSGYMAALLGSMGAEVTTIEIESSLCDLAESNLRRAGVHNVKVINGDGASGWKSTSETYDVIVISGSMPLLPQTFLAQLNPKGRLVGIIGEAPVMTAQLTTRKASGELETLNLFETNTAALKNVARPSRFHF